MVDSTYQGWSNYETWLVSLSLDSEPEDYEFWRERAACLCREAPSSRYVLAGVQTEYEAVRSCLAYQLERTITEGSPVEEQTRYGDLLAAALHKVNWEEVAEGLLEDRPIMGIPKPDRK